MISSTSPSDAKETFFGGLHDSSMWGEITGAHYDCLGVLLSQQHSVKNATSDYMKFLLTSAFNPSMVEAVAFRERSLRGQCGDGSLGLHLHLAGC